MYFFVAQKATVNHNKVFLCPAFRAGSQMKRTQTGQAPSGHAVPETWKPGFHSRCFNTHFALWYESWRVFTVLSELRTVSSHGWYYYNYAKRALHPQLHWLQCPRQRSLSRRDSSVEPTQKGATCTQPGGTGRGRTARLCALPAPREPLLPNFCLGLFELQELQKQSSTNLCDYVVLHLTSCSPILFLPLYNQPSS